VKPHLVLYIVCTRPNKTLGAATLFVLLVPAATLFVLLVPAATLFVLLVPAAAAAAGGAWIRRQATPAR
jgi:hypothetical protein